MIDKKRGRPKLVWVIFLFNVIAWAFAVGSLAWVRTHAASVPPQALAAFDATTPIEWVLTGLTMAVNLAGTFALFALWRSAFPLLVAGVCLGAIQTLLYRFNVFHTSSSPSNWSMIVGWVIDVAVCLYVRSLRSRSVLT